MTAGDLNLSYPLKKKNLCRKAKSALMAKNGSAWSSEEGCRRRRPISSFFSCPKLLTGFSVKSLTEMETQTSPTSILDTKPFSCLINPFWCETKTTKTSPTESRRHWDKMDSKRIGLGIVDDLNDPSFPMVLFGSHLKIRSPSLYHSFPSPPEPPIASADFGIKTESSRVGSFSPKKSMPPAKKSDSGSSDSGLVTPVSRDFTRCLTATEMDLYEEYTADFVMKTENSQVGSYSPRKSQSPAKKSDFGSSDSSIETPTSRAFTSCLSDTEMELSEEYTCVISHGPNPRTTHIFDDCIVESCTGLFSASAKKKKNNKDRHENFLSFCFTCKKSLGQGRDIYIYRGDQSFCSEECRYQEMIMEDEINRGELD